MDYELLERREELTKYMIKGLKLQAAAEAMTRNIADVYEREKRIATIRRDWGNRENWMPIVVRINDKTFLTELTANVRESSNSAWVVYHKTKNCSIQIGALRTVASSNLRLALVLMRAGVIEQAPQRVDHTVMRIDGTPFDCDPKFREALEIEGNRQREEKLNASGASDSRQE